MVEIDLPDPVAEAIFGLYEREAKDWRRPHLGASLLGHDCSRYMWMTFRWAQKPGHDGRLLRLFNRGDREEVHVAEEFRRLGWRVTTEGGGLRFSMGHVGGTGDGVIQGIPQAPKAEHLWECKTSNAARFNALEKKGVAEAEPKHYVQMQVYMHALRYHRALYTSVCKNDDRIYTERVRYDYKVAEPALMRAQAVVDSQGPPPRIAEGNPDHWQCRMCQFRDTCQLGHAEKLERNCRTCIHSTPLPDGTWRCEKLRMELDVDQQKKGCLAHVFIPPLLPWEPISYTVDRSWIKYMREDGTMIKDQGLTLVETK